jgi:hypothetical protein
MQEEWLFSLDFAYDASLGLLQLSQLRLQRTNDFSELVRIDSDRTLRVDALESVRPSNTSISASLDHVEKPLLQITTSSAAVAGHQY